MEVHVHLLPRLFEPADLKGSQSVVIDILRATTTIVHALAAGVTKLIACGEVEQAREISRSAASGTMLLGGERHGERIVGFDLDNSPLKYTSQALSGKSLVFTTTNGTRALASCLQCDRILVGSFVNRRATINALLRSDAPVHLVCAGTDGFVTTEDVLFAGSVAAALYACRGGIENADDETQLALALWRTALINDAVPHNSINDDDENAGGVAAPGRIREILRTSRGGRNLLDLGYDADIDRAAECDLFPFAAEFLPAVNEIQMLN